MLTALVLGALLHQPQAAAQTVTVFDRHLRQTTGDLITVGKEGATLRTGDKDVTVADPVAVVSASVWTSQRDWPGLPASEAVGSEEVTVRLADGSLLRGDLLAGKGEGLVLVNRRIGKLEFPLDALETLAAHSEAGAPAPAGPKRSDAVLLVNGDRLDGFVESIAPQKDNASGAALAVTIEHGKAKTSVPLDRVAWVVLHGNSKAAPQKTVWLEGGERTTASEFGVDDTGAARIVRPDGSLPATIKMDHVVGVLLDPGAVAPLARCAVRSGGVVEVGGEQVLGTRDLTLPEPEQVAFELPKGARRISGWAVLPEDCRRLGDCTVRLAVSAADQSREKALVEFALNGAAPAVKVDQELPPDLGAGAWLSVTVGQGKNGPVQDRVVLRRMLVGTQP